jgi:hypothetical protein
VDSKNLTRLLAEGPGVEGLVTICGFFRCSSKVAVISPRVSKMRLATTPLADDRRDSAATSWSLELWKVVLLLINRLCTLEIAAV